MGDLACFRVDEGPIARDWVEGFFFAVDEDSDGVGGDGDPVDVGETRALDAGLAVDRQEC